MAGLRGRRRGLSHGGTRRQHPRTCGELAYDLIKLGLVDEIRFWVDPAVWGSGDRPFHGRRVRMQLISATVFDSGVALLCYRPASDQPGGAAA